MMTVGQGTSIAKGSSVKQIQKKIFSSVLADCSIGINPVRYPFFNAIKIDQYFGFFQID